MPVQAPLPLFSCSIPAPLFERTRRFSASRRVPMIFPKPPETSPGPAFPNFAQTHHFHRNSQIHRQRPGFTKHRNFPDPTENTNTAEKGRGARPSERPTAAPSGATPKENGQHHSMHNSGEAERHERRRRTHPRHGPDRHRPKNGPSDRTSPATAWQQGT